MHRGQLFPILALGLGAICAWAVLAADAPPRRGDAWSDPQNPVVKAFEGKRLDLWSLRPPQRPPLPRVETSWCDSPLDAFVWTELRRKQLLPSRPAPPLVLLRRVTLDLTGLPPTPEQVQAFLSDASPTAYERAVDRLLASPRYAERAAQFWLDAVRYSDSNGFERDEFRPTIWRFRDYVVRSHAADKPYDVFVAEQLAGDELNAAADEADYSADRLIATGYLRLGPYDSTAEIFEEDKKSRDQLLADLANTTGTALLGLTYSCCRCHDHKYDPLLQADHFRLRAFFAGVTPQNDLPIDGPAVAREIAQIHAEQERKLAPLRAEKSELLEAVRAKLLAEKTKDQPSEIKKLLAKPEAERNSAEKKRLHDLGDMVIVKDDEAEKQLGAAAKKRRGELQQQIDELERGKRRPTTAWAAGERADKLPPTHLLHEGDYSQPGEEVKPGLPSALDPGEAPVAAPARGGSSGRRLFLARWIMSQANPLTARVLVNRVWQQHFGVGLVATSEDFGLAGARPTHPELLDWLACEFRDGLSGAPSGESNPAAWSLKRLHRRIVLSATYCQSSQEHGPRFRDSAAGEAVLDGRTVDGDNRCLWRQNSRRMDADSLHDSLLAASGLLRGEMGGPPRWPHVPRDILLGLPIFLEDMQGRLEDWYTDREDLTHRRSIYLVHKRCLPLPFLDAFDLPDSTLACTRRGTTLVAPQALALWNSRLGVLAARGLAERLVREAGPDREQQIALAFQLVLGRTPTADETKACRESMARFQALHEQHPPGREKAPASPPVTTPSDKNDKLAEKHPLPLLPPLSASQAALVDFSRAMLNLNEFVFVE